MSVRQRDRHPVRRTCTAAELFDIVWNALAEILGPTATAALMQRSLARAVRARADLAGIVIAREQFAYHYTLPHSWTKGSPDSIAALRSLLAELWPLLGELTGDVVVRRLEGIPLLVRCGVIPEGAES